MDQAAEPVPAQDPDISVRIRRMRTSGRRTLLQCPVWPVRVVVIDVLIKNQPQVPLASDQHPAQALADGAGDPAFRDRIRARRPDRRPDDPDPGCREHGVERGGELRVLSRIRNLKPSAWSPRFIIRLRACWVTHSPVG
jgi:hypothetical protein